ncbi:TPA: hypothetical protein ACKP22_003981 [Pseudomonas putida]
MAGFFVSAAKKPTAVSDDQHADAFIVAQSVFQYLQPQDFDLAPGRLVYTFGLLFQQIGAPGHRAVDEVAASVSPA